MHIIVIIISSLVIREILVVILGLNCIYNTKYDEEEKEENKTNTRNC